jgi:hypothetical protein
MAKPIGQARGDVGMRGPLGRHDEDLTIDELKVLLGSEDAGLDGTLELEDAKEPGRSVDRHTLRVPETFVCDLPRGGPRVYREDDVVEPVAANTPSHRKNENVSGRPSTIRGEPVRGCGRRATATASLIRGEQATSARVSTEGEIETGNRRRGIGKALTEQIAARAGD